MKLKDFSYDLPTELIAQSPMHDRQMSRLLVLNKNSGSMEHRIFKDVVELLNEGDCLVLNNTRVIPARLIGEKEGTGGVIEFLLLKKNEGDIWEVILKPGRKAKPGARFSFAEGRLKAEVLEIIEDGNRLVKFEYKGIFENILDDAGMMPLPPYITKKLDDKERYQTVYSKIKGSSAAPTAGLHFTKELLKEIEDKGIKLAYVTLHVGLGTFKPVSKENILEHKMHSEYYVIDQDACDKINTAKNTGKKVICVGTTGCRVVETAARVSGMIHSSEGKVMITQSQVNEMIDSSERKGMIAPSQGMTDIFIYPGYKFKITDALITNFHLPGSTLMMLVSALAGRENILAAYEEAIKEKYRFFSFGDAMLIV